MTAIKATSKEQAPKVFIEKDLAMRGWEIVVSTAEEKGSLLIRYNFRGEPTSIREYRGTGLANCEWRRIEGHPMNEY